MTRAENLLTFGTAGTGIGGAVIAQVTQSPSVTLGTLGLALIGLFSLWVRSYYTFQVSRLAVERLKTELEVYRRLCMKDHRCPFTPDGTPACAEADQILKLDADGK